MCQSQIEFPPLNPFEKTQQKAKHKWKIQSSTIIGPNGASSSTTAAEATLNCQSENAVVQNQALKAILIQQKNLSKNQEALPGRVHTVESIINDVRIKTQELHYLERKHKQQRRSTINDDPWRLPTTPFVKPAFDHQPLPLQSFPKPSPSLTLWASEHDNLKNNALFLPSSQANIAYTKPEPTVENTFDYDYDAEEAKEKFKFDDIPPSKWRLGSACDKKYLRIKCKDEPACGCLQKHKHKRSSNYGNQYNLKKKRNFNSNLKKKWMFLKKKEQRGRTTDRCYICNKKGHFVKDSKHKKKKMIALIQTLNQIEPVDVSNLESLYSLDDELGDLALCTIGYSESESSDTEDLYTSDSETTTDESDQSNSYDLPVFMAKPLLKPPESPPIPIAKVHLITNTYAKPLPVFAFFDTGSAASFLNPDVLPYEYWKSHSQYFRAANGETYQLQPHIAMELHQFPDKLVSQKEVQQFLGLVNYMADFLPKLSNHTVHLFPMLKKNPAPWTDKQA
ncbi:hypothetical protein E3N88_18071 [Mikania micrantha]|uniref:Uncharacterized protein n=1 Tax=Mikania micrantha TaxID=192012 RepID=A0A5N6NVV7_9ASTR|nr:hypothetical protein E3N88_18071 [Mikania micrantha]